MNIKDTSAWRKISLLLYHDWILDRAVTMLCTFKIHGYNVFSKIKEKKRKFCT